MVPAATQDPSIVTAGEAPASRRPSNVAANGIFTVTPWVNENAASSIPTIATTEIDMKIDNTMTNTRSIFRGTPLDICGQPFRMPPSTRLRPHHVDHVLCSSRDVANSLWLRAPFQNGPGRGFSNRGPGFRGPAATSSALVRSLWHQVRRVSGANAGKSPR